MCPWKLWSGYKCSTNDGYYMPFGGFNHLADRIQDILENLYLYNIPSVTNSAILELGWDDDGGELVRAVSWSFRVNKTRWIWVAQSIIEMWTQCFDVVMIIYNRVYCIASAATLSRTAIYYSIP